MTCLFAKHAHMLYPVNKPLSWPRPLHWHPQLQATPRRDRAPRPASHFGSSVLGATGDIMHVRVHRPVVCHTCAAEMSEFPGWTNWFKCVICGTKRHEVER